MIQSYPGETKLREDLIVSQQETTESEEASFVVKDPETGRFYRFREVEHFILQQLDGSTPPDHIRQRVEERFGAPLPADTFDQFIKTLRRLGLLETKDAQGHMSRRRGRIRGSLLYLRFKAFDPDRLFNRLVGKVRFCFTTQFLVCSAALIFLAAGITVSNWDELGRDFLRLLRPETVLFAWLTIFAVTTLHEFAHGLTCKHFGGEVHELGFLLIYFQPAMYCNVSEAWLFPKKSDRLWVTFAGPYFEIFLWALATLAWRVTDPETWLNSAALVVVATSGIKTFFNLNPLMKLDGYYLLSDYLDIPNLRERAFRYLREGIKGSSGSPPETTKEVNPRERRIYLSYGLAAWVYSASVLCFILLLIGGFMIDNYRGAGFALFVPALLWIVRKRLKKFLSFRHVSEKARPAPSAPGGQNQVKKKEDAALSKPTKVLAGATAILAGLFLIPMELRVWGEFKILPLLNTDVRAEAEGIITEIHVKEADVVKEGDLIARLSDRDLSAELRRTEAQIGQVRAKLKMLEAGPRQEDIEVARRAVETARTTHEKALKLYEEAQHLRAERLANAKTAVRNSEELVSIKQGEFERLKEGLEGGFISRREFDNAHEAMTVRTKELEAGRGELELIVADELAQLRKDIAVNEKQLEEAKSKLRVLLAGSRQEEIEGAEAEIASLEAQQAYVKEQIRLLNVVSPISGLITTPTRQLRELIGQRVAKGDLIAEVHELRTVTAEIAVSEQEIGDVQVGQPVVLKVRAYPGMTFEGKVRSIATTADERIDGVKGSTVLVSTQLDNTSLLLKPDMTGNAKIYCGSRQLIDIVTRRIARYFKVEFWSWW
jgi:putative peptide zinc metalloprotease protein